MNKLLSKIHKAIEMGMKLDSNLSLNDLTIQASIFINEHSSKKNVKNISCNTEHYKKHKLSREEFIKRAREIHGYVYDYSKVDYLNNYTKVCIICPIHGKFLQSPAVHLRGCGCPDCNMRRSNTENFIKKAKEMHCNKYDYSKVEYVNARTKVRIICPIHGEFEQTPVNHLMGSGCPRCGKTALSNTNEFIRKAKIVHGDKYDYSKVNYTDSQTKVCIICPKHGEFLQTPASHLSGHGCSKCAFEINTKRQSNNTKRIIKNTKKVHTDKYKNISSITKMSICLEHREF